MKMLPFFGLLLAAAPPEPGVAIGKSIPRFELRDQSGKNQRFETIKGPKGAMLVFYRSADW